MKPAFGNEEVPATEEKPRRVRTRKPKPEETSETMAHDISIVDTAPEEKPKRVRTRKPQSGDSDFKPTPAQTGYPVARAKTAAQLRKEAERMTKVADAAEAREALRDARAAVKACEAEAKSLERATRANDKALEKARLLLEKMEGPGA